MQFFFPDSQDLVDPSFDFTRELRSATRLRQRDDLYAHEVFDTPPYDGMLVSISVVEGIGTSKYTLAQRQRFRRLGVHKFLRAETPEGKNAFKVMGDCGAFNYVKQDLPPYTIEHVLRFYEESGFDFGISVDHVILDYNAAWDHSGKVPAAVRKRQELTLKLAETFLKSHAQIGLRFEPIGVAQGWSPTSYAHAVEVLQQQGYRYIALGGMVPLKTHEILASLEVINAVRKPSTKLHLLGISRVEAVEDFAKYGVASLDSTSPLKMAFKDDKHNYLVAEGWLTSVRIPQVSANSQVLSLIRSGEVKQGMMQRLERESLLAVSEYAKGLLPLDTTLDALVAYEQVHSPNVTYREAYRKTLEAKPWETCACSVCRDLGHHVILFRGAERNRRRGFHNLHVFYNQLRSIVITNKHGHFDEELVLQ